MSVTGQTVHDSLMLAGGTDTDDTVTALKLAIARSWPLIKQHGYYPDVDTFVSGTFEYSLATVPDIDRERGIARVYVNTDTDEPEVLTRGLRQRYDPNVGTWVLTVGPDIATRYAGKTFNVEYQYPHATISDIDDTLTLPLDYLEAFVRYWYASRKYSDTPSDGTRWRDVLVNAKDDWEAARNAHWTPQMNPIPHWSKDRLP